MNAIRSCMDFTIIKKEKTNSQTTYYQQIKFDGIFFISAYGAFYVFINCINEIWFC